MEIKDTGFLPEFDAGNLTQEAMVRIFLSCGTRDLAILRAVSKSWDAFISHENFKKLHLRTIVGNNDTDCLVVGGVHSEREKLLMILKNPKVFETRLFDFPVCATGMLVVASCHGLLCLADSPLIAEKGDRIVLWNPFTSEVRAIRLPPPKDYQSPSQSIGIAYSSRYDFTIVRIVLLSNFPLESLVQMYSDSWKDSVMIPFYTKESSSVFCIDGIPFWCGWPGGVGGTDKNVICSFDPFTNAFKMIDYPPEVGPYLVHPVNLGDRVCALVMCEDSHVDMYSFDELTSKWFKKFSTGRLNEQFNIYGTRKLTCFKNIGDIVVLGYWHTPIVFHERPGSSFVPHLGNDILGFKPHWTGPFPYTVAHGRAWQTFGNAWRGGSTFVQKLESSAATLADSINHGDASSVAQSLIESGKAFTARGMQVLEHVSKETIDLLIAETGIEVDKKSTKLADEDQLLEEVSFDRYFYIYGGPEQLEELEALSSHYALLLNRRKTKLSFEQKSVYDSKLKQVQQIFSLSSEFNGIGSELEKGKQVETRTDTTIDEMKNLHDSSVSKAAELAARFASALVGQTPSDIIQRTAGRLDSLHSEGVHRLSKMCCSAVSRLLMIGKSVISVANKTQDNDDADDILKNDWPKDSIEKAKVIRIRVQSMIGKVEEVSNSFITGISEVAEACSAAIKAAATDSAVFLQEKPIEDKAREFSENFRVDQTTAVGKIQDGLQYLSYLVLSTSMPSA